MSAADDSFRVWSASAVSWGLTMCEAPGCFRLAEVLADYDDDRGEGVPLCLDDADVLLERSVALTEPGGRELAAAGLPDPWELRRRPRGRRSPGVSEWELADRTPEKWLAEQGFYGEQTRRRVADDPDWDFPEEWGP